MLELKSASKNYSINLPTDLKEITPEILDTVTKDIELPPYYCIIALCFQVKLMNVAININGSKEQQVSVIPMLAKISEEDSKKVNAKVGYKVIMDRSSLERGSHLRISTMVGSDNVKNFIREDETLRQRLVKGGDGSEPKDLAKIVTLSKKDVNKSVESMSPQVYILEFKVVPVNDITATVPVDHRVVDPFKISRSVNPISTDKVVN